MIMVFTLLFSSLQSAFAEVIVTSGTKIPGYKAYHDIRGWGVLNNAGMTKFSIKGKTAFCIEAGGAIRGTGGETWNPDGDSLNVDYTIKEVTSDNSVQSKAAYLGYYSKTNPTIKDYAFTQMMIWQISPEWYANGINASTGEYRSYFVDNTIRNEYEAWKKQIQKKIDTWSTRPSFYGKTTSAKAGDSFTLTDSNKVLEDYNNFTFTKNGITVKHTKGSNSMSVSVSKSCEQKSIAMLSSELAQAGAQKYDSKIKSNYVYNSDNSQDVAVYGSIGDPVDLILSFNVDIITGKIAIEKTKSPDAANDNITPEAGAEFEVYLKSSGSYASSPADKRARITTDSKGYAITPELPHGTYTVKQTKGAKGHVLAKPFDVVIAAETHDKVYTYSINNETLQSKLQIVKKDAETEKIIPRAGTAYELINLTTGRPIRGTSLDGYFLTDETGSITLEKPLFYGDYEIIERIAPEGYILNAKPIKFTVDGTKPLIVIEQKDTPQKGIIKVDKTGEQLYTVEEKDGIYIPVYKEAKLKGAVFEVRAAEDITTPDGTVRVKKGTVVDTVTTDDNGKAQTKPLYLGEYEVEEIKAPENHVISHEIHKAELKYAGQEVEIGDLELSIGNERQRVKIDFEKLIEEDELFGIASKDIYMNIRFGIFAESEITAADGTVIPSGGLMEVIGLKELEGKYVGEFSADLPNAMYYVKEISADEKYILNDTKYPVDFMYNNQEEAVVEIKQNDCMGIYNNLKRGEIRGYKTGDKGLPLEGALFGLFKGDETVFNEENALLLSETDENGLFSFTQIPTHEKYIVKEIKAPRGHLLSPVMHEIVILEDKAVIEINAVNEPKIGYVEFVHNAGMMEKGIYVPVIPKTGDENALRIWLIVGLVSALYVITYMCIEKRRGNEV